RKPIEFKCADDSLGEVNFMSHTVKGKLVAVFVLLNKFVFTAAHWFKYFKGGAQAIWAKPLRVNFSVGICLEDQFSWCIKFPGYKEFLFAGFGGDDCLIF